jgi:hypothetical protein
MPFSDCVFIEQGIKLIDSRLIGRDGVICGKLAAGGLVEVRAGIDGDVDGGGVEAWNGLVDLDGLAGLLSGTWLCWVFCCAWTPVASRAAVRNRCQAPGRDETTFCLFILRFPSNYFRLASSDVVPLVWFTLTDSACSRWRAPFVCERVEDALWARYARSVMPVPSIIHASLRLRKLQGLVLLVVLLGFVMKCVYAKGPEPAPRIPLEPLGFQPLSSQFLLAGSSMLTVDFVDNKHLLLTYSVKRLLKRLPECPPSDQDRVIEAVLLELPAGKVLSRTSWRVHDHGQYLWNLGKGHFMLRTRDTLTTFAPVVNLPGGHAFRERSFITMDRRIGGVLISPDADLMILETLDRLQEAGASGASAQESAFSAYVCPCMKPPASATASTMPSGASTSPMVV